jgi:hypothetical protein
VDVDRAYRLATQGAPLAGIFECSFAEAAYRNVYDNHPPLAAVTAVVLQKLTEEEELSYHVVLPRWLWRFIPGLHISPLSWVVRNGKGRLPVTVPASLVMRRRWRPVRRTCLSQLLA